MQSNEDHKASVTSEIEGESTSIGHALKNEVHSKGNKLIQSVLAEGAALYAEVVDIDKVKSGDASSAKVVRSHSLGQQTKQLTLLYRDTLFEVQKAELLHVEGSVTKEQLQQLIERAGQTIADAEHAYQESFSDIGLQSRDANQLTKQDHPWPIYEVQLKEIRKHLETLSDNEIILFDLSSKVKVVKEAILERLDNIKRRFLDLEAQAENIIRSKGQQDVDAIMDLLNSTNQSLEQPGNIALAHAQIESMIMETPINVSPIVNIKGGALIEEDLSPQYQIEQWYDIEILPLVEDAYQQIDTMTYNFRLSLINISNRLELLQNNGKSFTFEEHLQPMERFVDSVSGFRTAIDRSIEDARTKVKENLTLYPVLSEDAPFLSIGFQSSINRFKKEQNLIIDRFGFYWRSLKNKYFSIKSTVREESQLGDIEKVIRYIQGVDTDRKNVQYNNFFNAKVTMVEAFWIGRDLEQKRIAQVVKSWNSGYQGAILFHGDRYSGKSSLGDWVSQQYFRGKTYVLKPNRSIMISKAKIDLSDDLIGSIRSFIDRVKYAKPMIWIDDLELWFDDEYLSDEVTSDLINLIIEYGRKVFFAVSVGSWMYHRLSRVMDLNHGFQATIELSPFAKEVLKEAILLRHGASHKLLIGKDGQEVTNAALDKYVSQITRQTNGNIGHALQLWVNSTHYKDDQHVVIKDVMSYKFPNIITSDNGIILSTLLIYRKISEEELKSLIGPLYPERYSHEVSRLVGYGIIRKSYNGILSINHKVVHAITAALRKNRFI